MRTIEELYPLIEIFADFQAPWYCAGGWALDIFLGRVTREHRDIDIAIFRDDQWKLKRSLKDWQLIKVIQPELKSEQWLDNEWLELPVHEIHAVRAHDNFELEIVLNETNDNCWIFRRDPRITLPLTELGRISKGGLPYLNPVVVLLYKAKNSTPADAKDFQAVLPALSSKQIQWFRNALTVCHPKHQWRSFL